MQAKVKFKKEDAELDITSFMNLMIVLVPVLLMMMVFSRITVVELNLPGISDGQSVSEIENEILEVQVRANSLDIYFPQGYLVQSIANLSDPANDENPSQYDFVKLQEVLKQIKQTLLNKGVDKKDISLLFEKEANYQTVVNLIDHTRSYKDVLINSVVDAELFPQVSLADAPVSQP